MSAAVRLAVVYRRGVLTLRVPLPWRQILYRLPRRQADALAVDDDQLPVAALLVDHAAVCRHAALTKARPSRHVSLERMALRPRSG